MNRIITKLIDLAKSNTMGKFKHAAAVSISGKVHAYGINNLCGGKTRHAEFSAIRRFLIDQNKESYIQRGRKPLQGT